jgi:hypothetical protein
MIIFFLTHILMSYFVSSSPYLLLSHPPLSRDSLPPIPPHYSIPPSCPSSPGKAVYAVRNIRTVGKKDMILNNALPVLTVDPETYRVEADGIHLTCEPASVLPLAQRYYLF